MLTPSRQHPKEQDDMTPRNTISLPNLDQDVFLLILSHLQTWDVVRCQKVSRQWRVAFSNEQFLQEKLKGYPIPRELLSRDHDILRRDDVDEIIDWTTLFSAVASRHYHLINARVRVLEHLPLAPSEENGHWFSVGQWDYHESQPAGRLYYENTASNGSLGSKPFLFRCSLWSYDDGLLVYAPEGGADADSSAIVFSLYDLETGISSPVPFNISSKVVRNIRLRDHTLIIEWAEKDPFHDLNDMEQVNRHFATCFDVVSTGLREGCPWTVTYRSEWKMHFLGLPLNHRDRFFSTHNRQHYVVYFWQPNRSMYTGDEELPIESLFVWDISKPSAYQPSTDPSGKSRPLYDPKLGPHVVARYPFHDLDYYGIRQHSEISLMAIHLESETNSIIIRENFCLSGQGYFDPAERLWCARTTMFPFVGQGPHLQRIWDGKLPLYRGHCSMESADVEDSERWFVPIMDVVDDYARVRFSLVETCFTGHSIENRLLLRVKASVTRESQRVQSRCSKYNRHQLPPTPPFSNPPSSSSTDLPESDHSNMAASSTMSTQTFSNDEDDVMIDANEIIVAYDDDAMVDASNYSKQDDEEDEFDPSPGRWATFSEEVTAELTSTGRIAGDERWLIGQNEKDELVIARF